ncbi:MAG: GAF domain-containing protein [Anaerolineae bacterium]|nr:GAF domain-containing protein [Anaerolineae bacterium]
MNAEARELEWVMHHPGALGEGIAALSRSSFHVLGRLQLGEQVVALATKLLSCPVALFFTIDPGSNAVPSAAVPSAAGVMASHLQPCAAVGMALHDLAPLTVQVLSRCGISEHPLVLHGTRLADCVADLHLPADSRVALLAPVMAEGQLAALICAVHLGEESEYSREESGFSPLGLLLMDLLATRVSDALEANTVYQGLEKDYELLQQRYQAMSSMYEISLELARQQRDLQPMLESVGSRILRLLDTTGGGIWLWREAEQCLELVMSLQSGYAAKVGARAAPGEGLVGQAYAAKQLKVRNDYSQWEGRPTEFTDAPFRAAMAIPLLWQDQVIGVLAATDDREERTFSAYDQYLGQLLASQVIVFIQNAQLFSQTRQTLARTEALYRANRSVTSILSLEETLQTVVNGVAEALNADQVIVYTFNFTTEEITHAVWGGRLRRESRQAGYSPPSFAELQQGLSGWVIQNLQPAYSPKGFVDPREGSAAQERRRRNRTGAIIVAPLQYRGQLIGTMTAFNSLDAPDFSPDDVDLMVAMATQAAAAVANAQLFADVEQSLRRTQALYQVGRSVMLTQDLDEALREITARVAETLPANRVSLVTFDAEARQITHFARGGPGQAYLDPAISFETLWEGLSGWVAREVQPALSPKGKPDSRESAESQRHRLEHHCGAMIVAPVMYRGAVIGTLTAINLPEEPDFTASDLDLLVAMVNQAAAAIANAQLFQAAQRRTLLLGAGAEISRATHSILELDELLLQSVALIRERFELYYVGVFLVDDTGEWAVLRAGTGEAGQHMLASGHRLRVGGQSMIGACVASRQARIALDVGAEAVRFENPLLPATRSEMALPLVSRDEAIGAMTIQSEHPRAFSADDILLLQTMADQFATAIVNARLFSRARHAALDAESNQILLQSVINSIPNPVFYKDRTGAHRIVNQAFAEQVLGLPVEQILGQTMPELARQSLARQLLPEVGASPGDASPGDVSPIDPAVAQAQHDSDMRLIHEPGVQSFEAQIPYADGSAHTVLLSKSTVFDAQGTITGVVGVFNDMTSRKQLLATLEHRTQQLQTAADISRATSSMLQLEELLPRTVELIREQFGVYYVGVFLIDDTGKWAVLRAGTGTAGEQMLQAEHRLQIGGNSMVGAAMQDREARIAFDVGLEAVRFENPLLPETRSEIALPLISRGDVIGALTIQSRQPQAFSDSDILVLQTVADQIANAIANAWLFAEAQARFEELQRIQRDLTGAAWSKFARGHTVVGYAYESNRLVPLLETATAVMNDERQDATVMNDAVSHDAISENVGQVWQERETAAIGELARGEVVLQQDEHGAFVLAPITSPLGEPLGVLGVDAATSSNGSNAAETGAVSSHSVLGQEWSEDDLALIQAVREQIGMALENRLLFEQTTSVLTETTTLYEVGQQISEAHSDAEILRAAIEGISRRPEPDRIIAGLFEPLNDPAHLRIVDGWVREGQVVQAGSAYPLSYWQLIYAALESEGSYVCTDIEQEAGFSGEVRRMFRHLTVRGLAAFQLRVRGMPYGAILIYTHQPHEFTTEELRFYTTLSQNTSVALENQFLLETTRQEAERRALLNEVMSTASASLDPDNLVHDSVQLIAQRLGMPTLYWKVDRERIRPLAVYRFDGSAVFLEETEERFVPEDVPELTEAVVSRLDYRWKFSTTAGLWSPFEVYRAELDLEEALVLPVTIRDEVLGVLILGQQHNHPAIDENETAFFHNAAVNIGVALENAQLYQDAQETAEKLKEVDRLKSEFLANMSHELRTPLNSIIGFSRVILKGIDGPITDLQKTDLDAIYQSGRHLLELINEILDHSKIEAGKMEYAFEPTDLMEIIRGIMSTSIALVKDKPIELQQHVPETLPTIIADSRRIRQVLLNLMGNASKFTEQGFIALAASADDEAVTISVQDSGVGIPKERYGSVFAAFEQVDSSSSRRYGGTGLGLPVSKKFVEAHGGTIWFESELGAGSTFFVRLPIAGPPPEPPAEESSPGAKLSRTTSRTDVEESKGRLVLTVDDDAGVITLFRRYLGKQGYRVVGLTRGDRVVEEAKRLKPYAITLDILMPDRSGWEVIRDLKSDPLTRDIPVVVCSIMAERNKGLSMGVADYLVKPILEQDLLLALERITHDPSQTHVLVVDDNADDRNLLQRILANAGYTVSVATNGVEAIAELTLSTPHLVVLDLMMPEVDGFAVLESMKARAETRDIPVVVVTAKELTADERADLTARVQALLQKGLFDQERLLGDVAAALSRLASGGAEGH